MANETQTDYNRQRNETKQAAILILVMSYVTYALIARYIRYNE